MVFSPRCRIPRPQRLYRARHCDWWSSEWRKGGGQLSGPPGWRWSPSGNTHTVMQRSFDNFMLTHNLTSSEGQHLLVDTQWPCVNSFSVAGPISLHFISLTHNSSNTPGRAAFIFNQEFFPSSLQIHLLLLVGKLLQLQVQQKGKIFDLHRWQSLHWIQMYTMRTTKGTVLSTNYKSSSPQLCFLWFG